MCGRRSIRLAATRERKIAVMSTFKAIVIDKTDAGQTARLTDFDDKDLMDGDVTVRVEWSTINYKDGLALTGKAPVVRRFPMIAGVDFAGTVEQSSHPAWKTGDRVILNGWGLGETRLGAYAEKARDRSKIAAMVNEIGFDEVIAAGRRIIDGKVRGRIVVKIG